MLDMQLHGKIRSLPGGVASLVSDRIDAPPKPHSRSDPGDVDASRGSVQYSEVLDMAHMELTLLIVLACLCCIVWQARALR